jgi:tRNA pseudouridine65 synthase
MKHIAHPIVGDATHGKGIHNRFFQQQFACHRLLLACVELRCRHPVDGSEIVLRASPGDAFADVLEKLGWAAHAGRDGCGVSPVESRRIANFDTA